MITGKMIKYEETPVVNYYRHGYQGNYYDDDVMLQCRKPPTDFEDQLEETIALAMASGFLIGATVVRANDISPAHGKVMHYDKSKDAWKAYSARVECLKVRFEDTNYDCNYHPSELKLVAKSTVMEAV